MPPTGYTPLFAPPEVLTNVNNVQGLQSNTPGQAQVGNLGLSASQEADLVNFLKILSDGYTAPNPVANPVAATQAAQAQIKKEATTPAKKSTTKKTPKRSK